jgi:AraC family transcriptional regulator
MAVLATFTVRYPSVFFIPSGGPQIVELENEQALLAIAVSPARPIPSVPYVARPPDGSQPRARAIADPLLRAIGETLHEELQARSASTTYVVSLANALRDHLVCKYASPPDGKSQARIGLRSSSLQRVHSFIANNLGGPIGVDDLAGVANMSPCHFAHMFKRSMGMPPHSYIMQERVQLAKVLIVEGNLALADVAAQAGFSTHCHFSDVFRRHTGMTPSAFRELERSKSADSGKISAGT